MFAGSTGREKEKFPTKLVRILMVLEKCLKNHPLRSSGHTKQHTQIYFGANSVGIIWVGYLAKQVSLANLAFRMLALQVLICIPRIHSEIRCKRD